MNHYVYEITNLINGKKYIGKRSCKCDIEKDKYMGSGTYLIKAMKKYGKDNFKKDILEVCESEEQAYESERVRIENIEAYRNPNYYNLAYGGNGFSSKQVEDMWKCEEHRKKMLKAQKDMWKNDKYREKMRVVASETMKITIKKLWNDSDYVELQRNKLSKESKQRWKNEDYRKFHIEKMKNTWKNESKREFLIRRMKEKYATDESKQVRSNASKRNWMSENYKENYVDKLKERWSDPKYKLKVSKSLRETLNSDEHRSKMKYKWESMGRKVVLLNNCKIFNSCTEASEYVNLRSASSITLCCNGNRLSAGKFKGKNAVWMYHDEYMVATYEALKEKLDNGNNSRGSSNLNLKDNSVEVICLNDGKVFKSLKEASKYAGLKSGSSISNCCSGKNSKAGSINGEPAKWMYYDEYLKNMEI